MDFKAIDAALAAYAKDADDAGKARLDFFRGLWQIQQQEGELVAAQSDYEAPDAQDAKRIYWSGMPVLGEVPVIVDAADFAHTCAAIAAYMADHAGLEDTAADALRAYDWTRFTEAADLARAGSDPAAFIEGCLQDLDIFGIDADCPSNIFMMVPAFALRSYLEIPAQKIMDAIVFEDDELNQHAHPLRCPVCGTPATAAFVGENDATDGRGRQLYCSMCGTRWTFDRIRCACCGTQSQTKLHYFNVEGDEAHRLQNCEECGDYMRTVFQDQLRAPLSMEVEDIVMADLDAIALDPRFRTGAEQD